MWREERQKIQLRPEAVRTPTQVNAPDHEEGVQATTPIKASRIILSMVATKGIEKERHCTASVVWRSMTTWNEKHETDTCWGEVRNILMGELVIGVPTTFVSENHGYVVVHRGINFPSSGSFECKVAEVKELIGQSGKGSCAIVICNIQRVHAHTAILRKTDSGSDHVDLADYKPICRLGGNDYGRTAGVFTMPRPPADLWKSA